MMDSAILSDSAYENRSGLHRRHSQLPTEGWGPEVFDGNGYVGCLLLDSLAIGNKELCRMATLGWLRRRGCATRSSERFVTEYI